MADDGEDQASRPLLFTVASRSTDTGKKKAPAAVSLDWNDCLCHCVATESGELTAFTIRSWQTLWHAAQIRRDATWEFLQQAEVHDEPRVGTIENATAHTHTEKV